MPVYGFGSGTLWGVPSVSNPTPIKFGVLQGVDLSIESNTKELYGQYQYPVAVARGLSKLQGKAKFAQISGFLFNSLFFNSSLVTGQLTTANDESGTVATAAITVANSATFVTDLGVVNSSTGLPYTRVASAPAAGQYSVSAGVYTFNASENGNGMKISYQYTVAGTGQKAAVSNSLIGTAPTFKLVLENLDPTTTGKKHVLTLNQCVASKLSFATKLEDFNIPDFEFSAFADSSGNLFTYSMSEVS